MSDRRRAERRGRRAEKLAALWLMARGFTILHHRRRMQAIEIDLVARRRGLVLLVEVKYRRSTNMAAAAVSPWAAERLRRAAQQLAGEMLARGEKISVRVDMIAIAPWRLPRHVPGIA